MACRISRRRCFPRLSLFRLSKGKLPLVRGKTGRWSSVTHVTLFFRPWGSKAICKSRKQMIPALSHENEIKIPQGV